MATTFLLTFHLKLMLAAARVCFVALIACIVNQKHRTVLKLTPGAEIVVTFSWILSSSQPAYKCSRLSSPLNVESKSNRSRCCQSLLATLEGGTTTSVPTNVMMIVAACLNLN